VRLGFGLAIGCREDLNLSEDSIPSEVRAFIAENIDSVVQLEILLLLHAHPGNDFTAAQISTQLRIDPAWAEDQLEHLCRRALLTCAQQSPHVYRYGPTDAQLAQSVDDLIKAYADRRVSVISLIFSEPVDKIQSFADAFRIRKDKNDG
jgi:hypothetical protein